MAGGASRRHWADAEDDMIRGMRALGASWQAIASAVGVSVNTLVDRAAVLGVRALPSSYAARAAARRIAELHRDATDRDPLPAGHPITWGAITRGTSLAGEPCQRPSPISRTPE
jgi:hypothetical protein